ncbi:hypothetical protein SEA_KEELAN_2 [Gordonia phage Keelan]|nr:hypothetical protein SEA_KEELAN_2 [Gordonia phage Keelan]
MRIRCLMCGTENDGHTHIGEEQDILPEVGDITVCASCGTTSRLSRSEITNVIEGVPLMGQELLDLMSNPEFMKAKLAATYVAARKVGLV